MKSKVALAVIGLLVGTGSAPVSFAADAGAGKAVFEKSCVGCHGADGKGNPAMAKVLGEKGLSIATIWIRTEIGQQLFAKVIA